VYRQGQLMANGIEVKLGHEDQAVVMGDADRLKQLLLNLVDNALKYTPAGGEVRLQGRVHRAEMLAKWVKAQSMAVGEATFSAEATGTVEDLNLTGEAHVAGFLMDDLELQELDLSAEAHRRGGKGFTRGGATLRVDRLLSGAFPLRRLEAQASLEEGKELAIYGDGRQVRDFNYVDDAIEALLQVAVDDEANGQVYNLGGDEPISLLHLAQLMVKVVGKGSYQLVPWPANRKRIDIGDYYGDYRKIRSKLGWCPRISLEEGLRRTFRYYESHQEHYWEHD